MKKGFTLVELIAVLVILAIIALIVTPNIMVSIKAYKNQMYDTEIQALESAAGNWAADNPSEIPADDTFSLIITIKDLTDNFYFDKNVVDAKNGGKFDDDGHYTFVIISCKKIVDEFNAHEPTYDYTYEAYSSIKEYVKAKAVEYAKDNLLTAESTDISLNDELITNKYINTNIKYVSSTEFLILSNYNITITAIPNSDNEYEYTAEID